jgi:dTDP-glucose 4,6-dehydratase
MKTMLITGGAGFIGHHLVQEFINDYKIICTVRPNSSNLDRLDEFKDKITIIEHDLRDTYDNLFDRLKDVEVILHAGGNPSAESSLHDPTSVVLDNIVGTLNLLELARKLPLKRFVFYGAGEVFGPIPPDTDSNPNDAYNSVSPYSASKAGGEELCIAYAKSFGVPVSITHITNTFGERSQSKRFPVIVIDKVLKDQTLDIHIGGRKWFYVGDVASQTRFMIEHQSGLYEKWNSCGLEFISNLDFATKIATILGKELKYNLISSTRPGHESHLSMNPQKFYDMGWVPKFSITERLTQTVSWYKNNQSWLTQR